MSSPAFQKADPPCHSNSAEAALTRLLRPRSIAVVGASARVGAFGQRLLHAINTGRYAGTVYPINPRYEELQGLRCYPSLAALSERADCAVFAVSDQQIEAALSDAAAAGVQAATIFGRCYQPAQNDHPSLVARLSGIAKEAGMAVCGANCMGFLNFVDGLKVSGSPPPLQDTSGTVGLISHSGSTWSGLIGNQRQILFNYAISAGQEIATTMADYIEFLIAAPETKVIACVLETVRAPDRFIAALENADRKGIPVVALKLGRTERGRSFALAHSGALAGSDAAYGAIFERHNVIRVHSPDELTDMVELFRTPRRSSGDGIGIVTDSGGERELIVDIATDVGAPLTDVTPATSERLAAVLDPGMDPHNPVDSYGDGRMLLEESLDALADDPGVGVVALATNLVHGRDYARETSNAVENTFAKTEKPVLLFGNIHSTISREEASRLRALGIPVLMGTASALVAMRNFINWQHRRLAPRPAMRSVASTALEEANTILRDCKGSGALPLREALRLLDIFGIASAPSDLCDGEDASVRAAERLGFPVALKTASADIHHKTEAGGVVLGIANADELVSAYRHVASACGPLVQVQKQMNAGIEILLGMTNDPQFGPTVTVALGGIFTEILADAVTFQPPISAAAASEMLNRLKGARLLGGFRGRPAANIEALAQVIERFGTLCAVIGTKLSAIDVNPVIAGPSGAFAVDALFLPLPNRC